MDREKELEFLQKNTTYLYTLYLLLKEVRGTYQDKMGPDLWKALNSSVARNYLLGVAALLDPVEDGRGNQNLSIHLLGSDIDLSPYADTVDKLKRFRRKAIAHNDREVMFVGDSYFDTYELKPEEVETLFEYMVDCLEKAVGFPFPKKQLEERMLLQIKDFFDKDS